MSEDQTTSNKNIQDHMDKGVLSALKQIENSMKDGSLMNYTMTNTHQIGTLPVRSFLFQVSLLHKKDDKNDND